MLKKDFFVLIIKLFGLYALVVILFNIFPQNLTYLGGYQVDIFMVLVALILSFLAIGLFVLLLFHAPRLVEILQLEKGFESDRFDLNGFSEEVIIKLAAIILGGILIIEGLPPFISNTLYAVSTSNTHNTMEANDKFYWVASFLKIVIGLFLLVYYKKMVKLLKP